MSEFDRPTNARAATEGLGAWVVEAIVERLGLPAMVVLQPLGFRNGYVRLPEGHPWIGRDRLDEVVVHGGITFTGEYPAEQLTPPTDVPGGWWIGFDCGHAGDAPEPEVWRRALGGIVLEGFERYAAEGHLWTTDEVLDECGSLAAQAVAAMFAGGD